MAYPPSSPDPSSRPLGERHSIDMSPWPELAEIIDVAQVLYELRYSEAGGGNLSYRVKVGEGHGALATTTTHPPVDPVPLPTAYPALAGETLFITARGARMRDVARDPAANLALIRLADDGASCTVLWGNPRISSETAAHLAVQSVLREPLGPGSGGNAVVHTHPANLVALTQFPEFQSGETLNRALFAMHHETRIFIPERLALVPYMAPGSTALAEASGQAARRSRVILWDKHGVTATGRTLRAALDLVEIADKAAAILLAVLAAGRVPVGLAEG